MEARVLETSDADQSTCNVPPWERVRRGDMEMRFRRTSLGYWSGLDAALYDTLGGFTENLFLDHTIGMVVGRPAKATVRCAGVVQRRLQVPGDIDIFPPGCTSSWHEDGSSTMLVVKVHEELVGSAAQQIGVDPDRVSIDPQLQIRDPRVEHLLLALKAEMESDNPLGRVYGESVGLALAAQLLRRYAPLVPRRPGHGLPPRQLRSVTDYIHAHIADDLTLTELAATVNLSPSHFQLLFKQAAGMPVHQFVIRSRVEYAMRLLRRSSVSLAEVASRSGFATQSHMARRMKRVTGMTPSALRRGM